MLAYTTLGVTDFEGAKVFYEALLGVIGAKYVFGNERIALYGTDVIPEDDGADVEPGDAFGMLLAHHQAKWPLASLRIHPTQQVPKGPRETTSPAWAAFVLAKKNETMLLELYSTD